ncbi:MAG: hypothetical protein IT436_00725 [Phycisphaerales bacterium]|nr:hypothetical protein [Phycisphaerales bacterium]
MRCRGTWCAAAALTAAAALSPSAMAQVVLTGNIPAGTYTYFDQDVQIYDATIVAGTGTTLTIRVNNGKISVGAGLYSWGIDGRGQDGADGWTFYPPQAGQPGTAGYSVVLETTPLMSTGSVPRDRSIQVGKPIDCSGGDGGDGAWGRDGYFDDCAYIGAEDGYTAAAGSTGGSIRLTAAGDIAISGALDTSGGAGGNGGGGGQGIIGFAGVGRPGRNGGNAGPVTVEQTKFAPANSWVSLYVNYASSGSILAYGGQGGSGGAGNYGQPGPQPGGNGGNGGSGGAVKVTARNYTMSAAQGVCSVATGGGYGGAGGNGGGGNSSSCYELYCSTGGPYKYTITASGGANSGSGGHGGAAGPITITSDDMLGMGLYCGLAARGGNGATAGIAGSGGVYTGDMCENGTECENYSVFGPGQTFPSGHGGAGGAITTSCKTLSLAYSSSGGSAGMDSSGGDGADGIDGSMAGVYCCGEPPEPFGGHGGQGGAGGAGGKGANISLKYVYYFVTNEPYSFCGGQGKPGGDGANGTPPGPGGIGGACGAGGQLIKNSVIQPIACVQCPAITGAGGTNDLGLCGIR